MPSRTHAQRILDLARERRLLRACELDAIEAPRIALTRLTASGLLERVGRGLYRLSDALGSEHESLVIVAARAPQAVFCLLTALQFHGLTTQLPRQVWIAMPRGSHVPRIDYPPLRMVQVTDALRAIGVEEYTLDGVVLRVTGVARTVVDCFRYRNRVGLDVALEALREVRSGGQATVDELWRCASACRIANVMRPYLDAIR